jgi:Fe-S cluster assembly iron-binding protein IscA
MNINISDAARRYMQSKQDFYRSNSRKPRLILVAKSCRGAEFRLVYEVPADDDALLKDGDCELFVPQSLLEEYGGFNLDTELFFFRQRLLVQPLKQTYTCDCSQKCNKEE